LREFETRENKRRAAQSPPQELGKRLACRWLNGNEAGERKSAKNKMEKTTGWLSPLISIMLSHVPAHD
jgi:hypothetical protein